MVIKIFSLSDYALFCEKIGEFQAGFEFVNGQIQDKFTGSDLPMDLVEYVLTHEIDYFPNFYEFMANPSNNHRLIVWNARFHSEKKTFPQGVVAYTENCGVIVIEGNVRKPDVVLADKKKQVVDKHNNLLNVLGIMEVLSPSTANLDFTQKLAEYQRLPTLQTYIIISQNEAKVWQYSRTENNIWLLNELGDMNDCIILDFLPTPVAVFLKEIYEDIEF